LSDIFFSFNTVFNVTKDSQVGIVIPRNKRCFYLSVSKFVQFEYFVGFNAENKAIILFSSLLVMFYFKSLSKLYAAACLLLYARHF